MFKKLAILLGILLVIIPSIALAATPLDPFVKDLQRLGVFDVIIFIMFAIIFFAILAKSKILGENLVISGIVATIVAFFIFLYPTFSGFSLVQPLSTLFTQVGVLMLLLAIAFVVSSLFYPDLPKMLSQQFTKPSVLYILIFIIIILVIVSRSAWVLWEGFNLASGSADLIILVAAIFVFIMILYVAASAAGGGEK